RIWYCTSCVNLRFISIKINAIIYLALNNANNLTNCKLVIDELVTPYDSYMTYCFKRALYLSGDIVQRLRKLAHTLRGALDLRHDYLVNRPFA
ncbi:hypothetical protein, partial [Psychrobacter celer]|uniref:hypothetical protein n=1 Tax=Psychrobacter celer TaxID=306572 RepID=UPI003FD2CFDF